MMDWPTALFFYILAAVLGGLLSWLYFSYGQKARIQNLENETQRVKGFINDITSEHKTALVDHSAKINMRDAEIALLKKKLASSISKDKEISMLNSNGKSSSHQANATSKMAKSMAEIMVLRQKVETLNSELTKLKTPTDTNIKPNKKTKYPTNKKDITKSLRRENQILEAQVENLIASLDNKTQALAKLQKLNSSALPQPINKGQTLNPSLNKAHTQKLATAIKEVTQLKADLSKAQRNISSLTHKLKEANKKTNTEVIETLNIKKLSKLLKQGKLTSKKVKRKS